ncbi:MAG TPA: GH92 family glycosyl hydrolase [Rariglobus sp.]|nr:GH92 family glycosyl hydrolase [Rariglobus sp.]
MKSVLLPVAVFALALARPSFAADAAISAATAADPASYVDPMIGTSAHGHVYPGATVPFGMVQVSPDTGTGGWDWCSGYHYSSTSIMGFSHTHLSGTGIGDLGNILIMPRTGPVRWEARPKAGEGYASPFDHSKEVAQPGYYKVLLEDTHITAELAATERAALHRYTFPASDSSHFIIDLKHKLASGGTKDADLKVEGDRRITGWQCTDGWAKDKTFYFVAEFSKPFDRVELQLDGKVAIGSEAHGKAVKGAVHFKTKAGEVILVRVGLSAVSLDGARKNLAAEMQGWDFGAVAAAARAKWNDELSRVSVDDADVRLKKIFYTALYHTMMAPTLYDDVDGSYVGVDRQVHKGAGFHYYSTFSLWDTFRAEHPLFTILAPEKVDDFVQSMLAFYQQSPDHNLPVWPLCSNETWCMIGNHAIPVIADAYLKGFRGFDAELAYQAMRTSAMSDDRGLDDYKEFGYIPVRVQMKRRAPTVSATLEYSVDDAAIARMAAALGKKDDAAFFAKRAQNFRNVFDAKTGFMRPRYPDGTWLETFNPNLVGSSRNYTEGSAWHYLWAATHDIPALIDMLGGREKFIAKLDEFFSAPVEGDQADVTGLIGQYAHGNEPCHHVAYLYGVAGEPWRTQERVREVMTKFYTDAPDGLCGNDDCGQMSAWYVFSAMGFYPADPTSGIYTIGTPLFSKITINLKHDGKDHPFVITAKNVSAENKYIQSASLNGEPLKHDWIAHEDIARGGTLEFVMGDKPNHDWR